VKKEFSMAYTNRTRETLDRSSTSNSVRGRQAQSATRLSTPLILQRAYADPSSLTPRDVKHLQRTIGNSAVIGLLSKSTGLQAALKLGPAGDQYEQEADRVAQQVVRQMDGPQNVQRESIQEDELAQAKPLSASISSLQRTLTRPRLDVGLQRQELEEEELQAKRLSQNSSAVQRSPDSRPQMGFVIRRQEQEEDELQMKPMHGPEGGAVEQSVEKQIQTARGGGKPLDDNVRSSMERGFGADFGNVRVHTGGQSDTLNRSLNARAFTVGSDIFFKSGEYNPGSSGGKELLAHELTHTVQQGAAGVQRSSSQTGTASADTHTCSSKSDLPITRSSENIQRLIGFEIETGIPAKNLMDDGSYDDPSYEDFNIDMPDGAKLDVDTNPNGGGMILEFASQPVDETQESSDFRNVASTWLQLLTRLRKRALKSPPIRSLDSVIPQAPGYAMYGAESGSPGKMERVSIQATHGLRLDKVTSFLENMKLANPQGASRVTAKEQSAHGAVPNIEKILTELKDLHDPDQYPKVKDRHVDEVAGFFALLANYMLSGKSVASGYAKNRSFLFYKSKMSDVRNKLVKENPYARIVLRNKESIVKAMFILVIATQRKFDEPLWVGTDEPIIGEWLNAIFSGKEDLAFEAAKNPWGTDIAPGKVEGGIAAVVEHRDIDKVVPQDKSLKMSEPGDILDYLTKVFEANKEWEGIE
jgi:hypothetical protein